MFVVLVLNAGFFFVKLVQLAFGVPFSRALHSFSSSKMAIFLGGKLVGSKNKQRKGVSPDTPSHIIQKHYEFYLANKIKSYRYMILFNLAYSVDVSFHCATLKVRSLRSQ